LTLTGSKLGSVLVKQIAFLPLLLGLVAFATNVSLLGQGVEIPKAPAPEQSTAEKSPTGSPQQPKPAPTPTAAEALYDYLQKYHIEVAKDQAGSRLVWTDRVLIEISDTPPPEPLAGLLATAPGNDGQFAAWVHDNFETQTTGWKPAKRNPHPAKAGTDEIVADGGNGHCFVNPVYMSYVLARYPKANILIKGPTDPALFVVNGKLHAVLSPWTQLPDGTPLQ